MSIYISTNERAFRRACAAKRLIVWTPDRKSAAQTNLLAFVPETFERLAQPWGDDDDGDEMLRQQVLATCAAFTCDQIALWALFKHVGGRRGVSEMRILAPSPGIRIVGGFLSDTAFVAVGLYRRDEIASKRRKLPENSSVLEWKVVLDRAVQRWSQALPEVAPMVPSAIAKK